MVPTLDVQELIHELHVHQTELEMQNVELLQAQATLAHSRDDYAKLFNQTPVGYLTVNREGLILNANKATGTMLKVPSTDLINRPFTGLIAHDSQDAWFLHRRQVLTGKAAQPLELQLLTADNTPLTVRCECHHDADLTSPCWCGMIAMIDITAQKQAEAQLQTTLCNLEHTVAERTAALQESEAHYRNLAENTQDILYSIDADGRILFIGPQASCYGFDPDKLRGCLFLDFVYPDDVESMRSNFKRALSEKRSVPVDFRIQTTHGTIYWFEERGTMQFDPAGAITGVIGVLRNITERKRAEAVAEHDRQQAQESEERYRRLFEAESNPIVIFDAETLRFVDINAAALKQYGYTRDEFLALRQPDINVDPNHAINIIHGIQAGKIKHVKLTHHRRKDGTVFPVEIATSRFVVNGRNVLCGIIQDITERQHAEELRERQQKQLEQLASMLARAQDDEQRRIAEGLHNDVAQILSACSVMLGVAAKAKTAAQLDDVISQIDDLLRSAGDKIRTLSFELSSSTLYQLGLREALQELCTCMGQRYHVNFEVHGGEHLAKLSDNTGTILFKAVRELLFNVVKHAGVADAIVSITREGETLKLTIEDNGKGFVTTDDHNGSQLGKGLGLFGIRQRMRELGGTIQIESTPSKGTRITLLTPVT